MRVACYEEGRSSSKRIYDATPGYAVRLYGAHMDPGGETNVIVTPVDDEARRLPGWHSDEDEPQYKMFVATPTVHWEAREVPSFNPHHKQAPKTPGVPNGKG